MNRTLLETARTMLMHANARPSWWAEAVVTAAFLRNMTPNAKTGNVTPLELITGHRPNITNLKVFGCVCYRKNDATSKLASKANICMFFGYSENHKAYKLYDLETKKCVTSIDVKFLEDTFPNGKVVATDGPVDHQVDYQQVALGLLGPSDYGAATPRNHDQRPAPQTPRQDQPRRQQGPAIVTPEQAPQHEHHAPASPPQQQRQPPMAAYPPDVDRQGRPSQQLVPQLAPRAATAAVRQAQAVARPRLQIVRDATMTDTIASRTRLCTMAAQTQLPTTPHGDGHQDQHSLTANARRLPGRTADDYAGGINA